MNGTNFCGCCGRESGMHDWCKRCVAHILPQRFGFAAWDRTYYAQHQRDCPFQIRENEKFSRAQERDTWA